MKRIESMITRIITRVVETAMVGVVEQVIHDRFAHMLKDVSMRISEARALADSAGSRPGIDRPMYAEDFRDGRARLAGYTLTNNTPAGGITWADLHIVYNGTDYVITNGNTLLKYAWWSPTTTPTVLQSSNTKPLLVQGETLVFINTAGTGIIAISDTHTSLPSAVRTNAIDTDAINPGAVTNTEIANVAGSKINSAIAETHIPVLTETKIPLLTAAKIPALDATKITTGTFASADRIPALPGTKINSAIAEAHVPVLTEGKIPVLTEAKIPAITDTAKIPNLPGSKITSAVANATNAVNATTATTSVTATTATTVTNGAITAQKLSIARHVLY